MGMKYMEILQYNQFNIKYIAADIFYIIKNTKEGILMLKFLAKTAEKYAKATNTACVFVWVFHQPKMPASMVNKD